ncbi:MAG: glycosyl hydrolase family 17 protein [Luminiphilus sp.]|nr:glycosyl hydrolase family 17 protein [Luminiphilus sp.]
MNQTRPLSYKRAICYSGFRDNQSPDTGVFPSESEILEDLLLLSGHWSALRVYACDVHTERVLRTIERERLPFKVMLGAYIGAEVNNPNCPWGGVYEDATLVANKEANRAELDRAIAWANRYPDIVDVVSVGNEATVDWTDHLIEPETVKAYASDVRSQIKQPVTFCENYVPWLTSLEELAANLDVISIHTYPVWEYKTLDEAMDYTRKNFEAVQARYPDKQVIITEAGWATASNGRGIPPDNVGEILQREYLEQLLSWAEEQQILVYVFEAFDENWKGSDHPLEPEKHWGLYRADRSAKPALSIQR